MRELRPEQRLIVAADYVPEWPNGREWVRAQVLELARQLHGTGVCLKANSGLRACGYDLIEEIHDRDLDAFADLKLIDITQTMLTDAALIAGACPEMLTVMGIAGVSALQAIREALPNTLVLTVSVLTNLTNDDTAMIFGCSVAEAVDRLAKVAQGAGMEGMVSSAKEVPALRSEMGDGVAFVTPAIRPAWAIVDGDDQNPDRIMTPAKAIHAGAEYIVVGRPIVQAKSPYDAAMRTIDEIADAL